jgi:2-phosphoglycerate kinase
VSPVPVATFDTLKFANTLKAAGVPPAQAEAEATAFAEDIQLNLKELVTKDDLTATAKELKQEVKDVELRLNGRIDTLAAQIKGEMLLLKWMFGALLGVGAAILVRLFFFHTPI